MCVCVCVCVHTYMETAFEMICKFYIVYIISDFIVQAQTCTHIHTPTYIKNTDIYTYTHIHIYMHAYLYRHTCMYIYMHTYKCKLYIYEYIYAYIYIYIYIWIFNFDISWRPLLRTTQGLAFQQLLHWGCFSFSWIAPRYPWYNIYI